MLAVVQIFFLVNSGTATAHRFEYCRTSWVCIIRSKAALTSFDLECLRLVQCEC